MYLYLEDKTMILNRDIIIIMRYEQLNKPENEKFLQRQLESKKVIQLSSEIKSVIVTDKKIYFSSYGAQTLEKRGKEFFKMLGGMK